MANTTISQTGSVLVVIDISMTRHEVLIDPIDKKRRRRLTILNQLEVFNRLIVSGVLAPPIFRFSDLSLRFANIHSGVSRWSLE